MITFKGLGYAGAIGNQLFQYAALYSTGKINNFQIKIPNTKDHYDSGTNRIQHYFLNCFSNIKADILTSSDESIIKNEVNFEKAIFYYEELFNIKDFTNINGYFQSYKYFENFKEDILDQFIFKKDIINNINKKYNINFSEYSAVHLRYGDYSYRQNHHPIMNFNYYEKAFNIINDHKYLVFSDTIEYAKNIFSKFKHIDFTYIENNHPFEDMYMMSNTKNNIIANSTFSWWASYINKNNPKIIAPLNWLGVGYAGQWDINDLIPKNWIVI